MTFGPKILYLGIGLILLLAAVAWANYLRSTPAKTPTTTATYSAEEKSVLTFPVSGSAQAEIDRHNLLIDRSAQKTDSLSISLGCRPDPLVVEIESGKNLTIRNLDSSQHILQIGLVRVIIPPSEKVAVKADFGAGDGRYGYFCDNSQDTVGIIKVTSPS